MTVVWLTGLSGSGKTTIAREFVRLQAANGRSFVWLDGDELRAVFLGPGATDTYSVDSRRMNGERIHRLVRLLDDQGHDVVVSVISLFPDLLERNRQDLKRYVEISLEASLNLLKLRDPKGLYAGLSSAPTTNFVGVTIPYPLPAKPDCRINMDQNSASPVDLASSLVRLVDERESR